MSSSSDLSQSRPSSSSRMGENAFFASGLGIDDEIPLGGGRIALSGGEMNRDVSPVSRSVLVPESSPPRTPRQTYKVLVSDKLRSDEAEIARLRRMLAASEQRQREQADAMLTTQQAVERAAQDIDELLNFRINALQMSTPAAPSSSTPPAAASPAAHVSSAVAKISPFSAGDPTAWVLKTANILQALRLAPDLWVATAATHLEGAALIWWEAIKETRPTAWDDFTAALKARFWAPARTAGLTQRLATLRCGANFDDYVDEFTEVVLALGDVSPAEQMRRFIAGLPSHLANLVINLPGNIELRDLQERLGALAHRAAASTLAAVTAEPPPASVAAIGTSQGFRPPHHHPRPPQQQQQQQQRHYSNQQRGYGDRQYQPERQPYRQQRSQQQYNRRPQPVCDACRRVWTEDHSCQYTFLSVAHPEVGTSLLFLGGVVKGRELRMLLDCGASECFIDRTLANELHLTIRSSSVKTIILADKSSKPCLGAVPLDFTVQGVATRGNFLVADIGFQAILGLSWLRYQNPKVDWSRDAVSLSPVVPQAPVTPAAAPVMLSSIDFELQTQEDDHCFLVSIAPDVPPTKMHGHVAQLVEEYKDALFLDDLPPGLPKQRGPDFTIDLLPGARPHVRPMPRFSHDELEKIHAEIKDLLQKGFIRPSSSPMGAQILFVKKKDGSSRMCLDFRSLNEHTVRDVYPLPLIDALFDKLAGKKVFSSLDLRSGYFQMRVAEKDAHKTAFRSPIGSYEYLVVPFGVCNAPSAFSRMIDHVFPPLEFGDCLVKYIDDLLIFSDNMEDHLVHLRRVFDRMTREKLYPKLSKCRFGLHELEFLGHVVGRDGIKPDPHKVNAVLNAPAPTNLTELRGFLGILNYFQRFIDSYAHRSAILTDLTKKDIPWSWTPDHAKAFQDLKSTLVSAPVLRVFDRKLDVVLQTDASAQALGGVLLQNDGHGLRPVCYTSKKLSPTQARYPPQQLEMFAIMHAVRTWRHYLMGRQFTIESDHQSLERVKLSPKPTGRLADWYDELAEYSFKVVYRPGPKNKTADYLSRFAADAVTAQPVVLSALTTVAPADPEFLQRIRDGYAQDTYFAPVAAALIDKAPVDKRFKSRVDKFIERDGVLVFRKKDTLCIPDDKPLRTSVLIEIHDAGGHFGVDKCYEALERRYFWPHMGKSTKSFVMSCDACQRQKGATRSSNGLIMPLEIPERAWSSVSMDFVTGLPQTVRGNDAVLTVVDRLTKMTHVIPTTTTATAQDTASTFFSEIYRLHGLPRSIVSDRDNKFTSEFWQTLFTLVGTKLAMSTVNHAKTDGQTEAQNKTIGQLLRTVAGETPADWDLKLPFVEFAMNNSVNSSTKVTPFYANYGLHPWVPADLATGALLAVDSPDVMAMVDKIATINKLVEHNLSVAQDQQAATANRGRRDEVFKVGDLVYVSQENRASSSTLPSATQKLRERFHGPYVVKKVVNNNAYKLEFPDGRAHTVVNVEFLKRHHPSPPEFASRVPTPAAPDERGEVEIDKILDVRTKYNKDEYLVRWVGHSRHHDEWLKRDQLPHAQEIIAKFEASRKKRD